MTLYKKTLVILGVTFVCLLLVLYISSRFILMDGFSDIEQSEVAKNSQRALNIIEDDISTLSDASRNWASTDATFAFVADGNRHYIDTYLADKDSWVTNGVNAMVFTGADGQVVYAGGFDLENDSFVPLPDGFLEGVVNERALSEHPEEDCALFGIVTLPSGPMMVASVPVTSAGATGPAGGNLIWGRFLDEAEINRINGITLTDIALNRTEDNLSPDMESALVQLQTSESPYITTIDDSSLGSYSLIDDINGEPALIMRVVTPRDIHHQGEASVLYLVLAIIAAGLVISIVIITLLNRLVIRRMKLIGDGVRKAASTGNISEHLDVSGNDELSTLGNDINNLLEALELSHSSLGRINVELEDRVKEKTKRLHQEVAVLATLSDIDKEIIAAHDAGSIQSLVCERTADLLNVPKVIIVLQDPDGVGHVTAAHGLDSDKPHYEELAHLFNAEVLDEMGLAQKSAVGFDEVTAYDLYMPELIARENAHSLAIAPLRADKLLMGALLIFDVMPRKWSPEDIQILGLLAGQVALGIDTARLFEQEQTRRKELGSLYRLSRELADTAPDIDMILSIVARTAVETVNVTFCRIALLAGDELFMRSAYPRRVLGHDLMVGYSEPISSLAYCKRILKQNSPEILKQDEQVLSCHERDIIFSGDAKAICIVPLKASNKPIGLLILGEVRHEEREQFNAEKIELARNIGDQAASTLKRAELFSELEHAYMQTVLSLANAVDARDEYTSDHGQVMAHMALAIGRMYNMSPLELESLHYAAMLHDVGKIGVSDMILQKPAELTVKEWDQMRKHSVIGEEIMSPVPYLGDASQFVRHHHEHYDGSGYPDKLVADEIPLGSRILAVVDSYCAMRDKRVYKDAVSHEDAVKELKSCSGTQFDPKVVTTFIRLMDSGIVNIQNRLGHHLDNDSADDTEAA